MKCERCGCEEADGIPHYSLGYCFDMLKKERDAMRAELDEAREMLNKSTKFYFTVSDKHQFVTAEFDCWTAGKGGPWVVTLFSWPAHRKLQRELFEKQEDAFRRARELAGVKGGE